METIISGYNIIQEYPSIHKNTSVVDAVRNTDEHSVVIKYLKHQNPSLEEIEKFKNEYEILERLKDVNFVPKILGFEKTQHSYALILDKISAPSLTEILKNEHKLTLEEFLTIAIQITQILSNIHNLHIIHNDINPTNILYDKDNKTINLIGFGSSSRLSTERAAIINPNKLEAQIHYISPEQTGRMNRSIDYRSDFYSLGITFYQMLTGQVPFTSASPMKIIHNHMAVLPEAPNLINHEIPKILSDIILKLLAKTAEDRYQSTRGLLADLQKCQKQLTTGFEDFKLGQEDVFNTFHMPEKLYGRTHEIEILLKSYDKARVGKIELILVEGFAGIGKTALVHELYKPITQLGGFFVSGKYDQFKHHIPYAALIQALNEWIIKVLTEDEAIINNFKKRILSAVKDNGQVILDVMPTLENIIGPQPQVQPLEQTETQNRFHYVFQAFISAISSIEYPLVIFLDDLQWADLPSLSMLETLLTSLNCRHILIIAAYRTNEIDETHPLKSLLEKLNKRNVIFASITLGPLSLENVEELIAEVVHRKIQDVSDLAQVCYQKTNGNPFFLLQLLRSLHKEHLIRFDSSKNHWTWVIEKIKEKGVTDNVIDLMITRIQQLPPELQYSLQYAACIGNRFNLKLLSHVSQLPVETLFLNMQHLLEDGFIISGGQENDIQIYQFSHDRIQQAAHLLLDEKTRNEIHLELARYILKNTKKEQINDTIFDIIDHYNFNIDSNTLDVMDRDEKFTVAKLNLQASKLAKTASAYDPALKYVEYALFTVDDSQWKSNYDFMIDLHTEAAETAYLSGKHKLMEFYADILEKRAKNIYDQVKVIQTKVFSYSSQEKHSEALDAIINALRKLDTKLPRHPNQIQILLDVMRVKFALYKLSLKGKKISDLANLPEMQDHTKRIVINLLKTSYAPAYLGEPDLFAILVCQAILISLKYGNAKDSAYPYICFGMVCCDVLKDINMGYELGQMANSLNIKMHDEETATKLNLVLAGFIRPWKEPIKDCLQGLYAAYERGFENGDLEYGCYGAYINIAYSFFAGLPIKGLIPKIKAFQTRFTSLQLTQGLEFLSMTHNGILPFIEKCDYPFPDLANVKDISILFNTYNFRLIYSYYMADYQDALKAIDLGSKYSTIVAWQGVPIFYFYQALNLLKIYSQSQQRVYKKIIKNNLKKMQFWAKFAPGNHSHKVLLLKAEILNIIENKPNEAIALYVEAIDEAKKNEYLHEEALANELLGECYLKLNNRKKAQHYLNEANYIYLFWGADSKASQMKDKYKDLF